LNRLVREEGRAVLSGLLLILSFPKFGHWAVAWVALTPLLLALRGTRPRQAAWLAYIAGVVAAVGLLYWTALTVIQFGGLSLPVGIAVMLLLCLAVALYPALFGWMMGLWQRRWGNAALLLAPVAWVATEILRSHTLYGFAWCLLGYSQQPNLPFIQIASVTAVFGVSFLVATGAATLAYVLAEKRRPRRLAAAGGCVLLLAIVGIHGWSRLSRPIPDGPRVRVGLVQASVLQEDKWDPEKAWENVGRHLTLTAQAANAGAHLVVWPESSLPFEFEGQPVVENPFRDLVRQRNLYLLFGNDDHENGPQGHRVWVGAKMLDPEGGLSFRYHKIRLVPFGEYVPLQPLLTLGGRYAAKLVREVGEFTPGTEYTIGTVEGHGFAASICYEAIFPDLARQFTSRGADLLVNMTNDGWYGTTSAPYQHFAMAAFRAVENGKYFVRAANTGITAVVDPRGRVVARTALFDSTALVRDVTFVPGETFYARHGDVFAWGCLIVAALLCARSFFVVN
jgi:apolipoprotein N-acyltransferase